MEDIFSQSNFLGKTITVSIASKYRQGRNPSTGERFLSTPSNLIKLNVCQKFLGKLVCVHVPKFVLGPQPRIILN